MNQIHITKERKVITYSDLWRTSEYLLTIGQNEEKGSYFMFLSSLMFKAFSLEAFLNHIGEHVFETWGEMEKPLSPKAKLSILCEQLNIKADYGKMPWQIVPEIIGFRNKVAHGRNHLLTFDQVIPANDQYEKIMHEFLVADWQDYACETNALKVKKYLEELFKLVHKAAEMENDFLFQSGMQIGSAKIIQRQD